MIRSFVLHRCDREPKVRLTCKHKTKEDSFTVVLPSGFFASLKQYNIPDGMQIEVKSLNKNQYIMEPFFEGFQIVNTCNSALFCFEVHEAKYVVYEGITYNCKISEKADIV